MTDSLSDRYKFGGLAAVFYRKCIATVVRNEIHRQRIKLLYDVWWYLPLLTAKGLSLSKRVRLLRKVLRVDWNVLVGSKPAEVVPVMLELMSRRAQPNEAFIEAGCWNGGSTAKFSLVCREFGYSLHVFDSFQGVKEWNYLFAAAQALVEKNIATYGDVGVCSFHPGWFKDTLANRPVPFPVRMVYIDCDVPEGTKDALSGLVPALVGDGVVYTQDYQMNDVKDVFNNPKTWSDIGVAAPKVRRVIRNLARVTWQPPQPSASSS